MQPEQSAIHIFSPNLGRTLGPELSERVVQAARDYLQREDSAKRMRGFWVMAFGDDLHLHLTTFGGDFQGAGEGPRVYVTRLARGAAVAALAQGLAMGLGP